MFIYIFFYLNLFSSGDELTCKAKGAECVEYIRLRNLTLFVHAKVDENFSNLEVGPLIDKITAYFVEKSENKEKVEDMLKAFNSSVKNDQGEFYNSPGFKGKVKQYGCYAWCYRLIVRVKEGANLSKVEEAFKENYFDLISLIYENYNYSCIKDDFEVPASDFSDIEVLSMLLHILRIDC